MNKKTIFLLMFVFLFLSFVSALEQTIVETEITLKYIHAGSCISNCTNYTIGNTTTETCYEKCSGVLRVEGENLLKEFAIVGNSWQEIVENNVVRELGNETDVTNVFAKLGECLVLMNKTTQLDTCIDSNRNISYQLRMLEEDAGYKTNYTECDKQITSIRSELESKSSSLVEKINEVDKLENSKFIWGIAGLIIGALFIYKGLPKLKGIDEPKDASNQHPSTAKY